MKRITRTIVPLCALVSALSFLPVMHNLIRPHSTVIAATGYSSAVLSIQEGEVGLLKVKPKKALKKRPWVPNDINLFYPPFYPAAIVYPSGTGLEMTEEQALASLRTYLQDAPETVRNQALTHFSNPDVIARMPSPEHRWGLAASLKWEDAAPAVEFFLNAKTLDGQLPLFSTVQYVDNLPDGIFARSINDGTNGQKRIIVNRQQLAGIDPRTFITLWPHEFGHSDSASSSNEEFALNKHQIEIYAKLLLEDPSLAGQENTHTQFLNSVLLARLNSGQNSTWGVFSSRRGGPVLPGSTSQATDFYDSFFVNPLPGDTPGNALLRKYMELSVEGGNAVPSNPTFSLETAQFFDQNNNGLPGKNDMVKLAEILNLNTKP